MRLRVLFILVVGDRERIAIRIARELAAAVFQKTLVFAHKICLIGRVVPYHPCPNDLVFEIGAILLPRGTTGSASAT